MVSKWPSRSKCWQRLRDAQPPSWVLDHVACVERLATAMAQAARDNGHDVDVNLVQAGAILHDIGRSITQDPTHAHQGAHILNDEDWPEPVIHIVARHTGAGLTADDAAALGLPHALIPETLEERIVAHADNLYSGSKRLTLAQIEAKYTAKGLPAAFARIRDLHSKLQEILGSNPEDVPEAELGPA